MNGSIIVTEKYAYYHKNNKLYRVELKGANRQKISEKDISYYQISGNWIYYIYKQQESQYIARMKLNGEDAEKIIKAEKNQEFKAIYVQNSKVYYILAQMNENYDVEYYLCKMNKKGEKLEKICKLDTNATNINMQEDNIYYTVPVNDNEYKVNSIKYNGTDRKTLTKQGDIKALNVMEDWVIVLTINDDYDQKIKMINKDGKEEKIL